MEQTRNLISVLELKRLLVSLREHRPDICMRFRMMGQMWSANFMRVIHVTESGVLLNDETDGKLYNITDLTQIMQFELDHTFQAFSAHFHYEVSPFLNVN